MIWRTHFVPEIRLYTEVSLTIIQSCLLQLPGTADSEMKVMGGFLPVAWKKVCAVSQWLAC